MKKIIVLLFVTTILCSTTFSQTETPPPCSTPEYNQFDFWVGEWEMISNSPVTPGTDSFVVSSCTNTVTKELDNCAVHEQFDGGEAGPLVGRSYSVYNPQLKLWQQTWVDNQGSYMMFEGGLTDGEMILSRTVEKAGAVIHQRMVFKDITENSLTWHWETSKDGGETWTMLWELLYKRMK